ncbi:MAG: DedA family protein [Alphaproteobacteria bacterium]|nr:DedA family protein [Alphaproteobacteria bacterium]
MSEHNPGQIVMDGQTKDPLISLESSQPASLLPPYYSLMFYCIIFLESCIFPIPPDPFFIIQALKNSKKIWFLAAVCTIISTMGGCVAYGIGFWFYDHWGSVVIPLLGGEQVFFSVQGFMQRWGSWAIIAKGFSPVPYKIMALISGITHFSFLTFFATSLLARGIRFGLLAMVLHRYQEQAQKILNRYQNWMKRGFFILLISGFVLVFLIQCIKTFAI